MAHQTVPTSVSLMAHTSSNSTPQSASIEYSSSTTSEPPITFRLLHATGPEKAAFWWELCWAITSCERQTHFIYLATEHISTRADTRDLLSAVRKCSAEGKAIYERALQALEGSWDQVDRVIRVDVERKLKGLQRQDAEWRAMAELLDRVEDTQAELELLRRPQPLFFGDDHDGSAGYFEECGNISGQL